MRAHSKREQFLHWFHFGNAAHGEGIPLKKYKNKCILVSHDDGPNVEKIVADFSEFRRKFNNIANP